MSGLALGSYISAKLIPHMKRNKLIDLYILLQLLICFYGILSKPIIHLFNNLILNLGILQIPLSYQYIIWFIVTFLILITPTTLMGATLPLLTQWFIRKNQNSLSDVGLLYGFNTLGAVISVTLYGFFIIPVVGITKSILFCSIANFFSSFTGLIAKVVSSKQDSSFTRLLNNKEPSVALSDLRMSPVFNTGLTSSTISNYGIFLVLFLSGFAGLICEIAWTRTFAIILGSSTYTFSIVLITFLSGLSSGNIFYKRFKKNVVRVNGLMYLETGIALTILLFISIFNYIPYVILCILSVTYQNIFLLYLIQFIICTCIMFIPTFLMGITFPWAVELLYRNTYEKEVGSLTGICYSINTVGSILGSFIAGFIWLPLFGTEVSILSGAFIYILSATIIWFFYRIRSALAVIILGILTTYIFIRPKWDIRIISSGAFLFRERVQSIPKYTEFVNILHQDELLYYKDGISSTIAVFKNPWDEKFMLTNGKPDASSTGDMPTQLILGYLPFLFYSGVPETALVVGLGSGVTLSALAEFSELKTIDCIEIEPAVKQAASFFSSVNHYVLEDKRVNLIFADARQYFYTSKKKYDIITSEPSNPWIAGIANLYTKEAFELVKQKLNKNGIFCQWIHSYSMSEKDFKMILATFISVFPNVILTTPKNMDYLLIGSLEPFTIDYNRIRKYFYENLIMQTNLKMIGFNHPFTLIANTYIADSDTMREYTKNSQIHFDDKPVIEFSAPRNLYIDEEKNIVINLSKIKKNLLPENLVGFNPTSADWVILYNIMGEEFMYTHEPYKAEQCFNKALELNSKDVRSLVNIGRVYNVTYRHLQSEEILKKAISIDPGYALAYFHLGMLYLNQGLKDRGLRYLEKGLEISPYDPMATLQIAEIYINKGRNSEAKKIISRTLSRPVLNPIIRKSLEEQLRKL